ncbi:mitochondrial import inner membrane translocase subunit Tim29 [Xylocopa sonorina]|uniref:mitochondrial import inner membrane translocase subunit Tim29 n=1 Tax=Xylocopa sonorina TaxID=1818115 RepID=UPI00403B1ED1
MSHGFLVPFRKYKVSLKLTNSVNDAISQTKSGEVAKKAKESFLERWAVYWKNLYADYKEVAVDTAKDCKEHPVRTSIYASLLASCVYLSRHNPSECTFKDHLMQNTMKIMQVGEPIRNPVSEQYVKWLAQCYNEGIVRHMNLGVISLIWLDDYDKMCTLYKAVCPYLQVRYVTFYQRVVDFGFLDKWWVLEKKMKDYDVNEAEFSNVQTE